MIDNSEMPKLNSSTIINHLIKFILKNKFNLLIIFLLSIGYAIYLKNHKILYRSTAIIDTKEIIKRDVMKEMVHDYFKSNNHPFIKSRLLRSDTIKNGTRFYLDIYSYSNSYEKIENELTKYLISSEIVIENLSVKHDLHTLILNELKAQINSESLKKSNGFSGNKNIKLSLLKDIEEQSQSLLFIDSYNPIEKGFGIPEEIEKIRSLFVKNFTKAFFSGLITLLFISFLRKKLSR